MFTIAIMVDEKFRSSIQQVQTRDLHDVVEVVVIEIGVQVDVALLNVSAN